MKGLNWLLLGVISACLLVLAGGGGIIGQAAPFALPSDMPVAVAYAIDGSITGVQSLGKSNPGVLAKVQQMAGVGHYREVDVNTSKSEPDEVEWVKQAWNALDKSHPPQWVASGPRGGWKSKALPTKPEDAEAALRTIMKP